MYKNRNSNYISFLIKEAISPEYLESKLSKIKDILAASGIRRIKRFSPEGGNYFPGIKSMALPKGGFAKLFLRSGNKNLARAINNLGMMHEYNEAKTMKGILRGKGTVDLSAHANISVPKTDLLYLNVLKKKYPELEGYYQMRRNELNDYNKQMKEYASMPERKEQIARKIRERVKFLTSKDYNLIDTLRQNEVFRDQQAMTPSGMIKLLKSTFSPSYYSHPETIKSPNLVSPSHYRHYRHYLRHHRHQAE